MDEEVNNQFQYPLASPLCYVPSGSTRICTVVGFLVTVRDGLMKLPPYVMHGNTQLQSVVECTKALGMETIDV